jgi:hypothetical protein
MPSIDLRLVGDGAIPEMAEALAKGKVHHVESIVLSGLDAGMQSGRPSVVIAIPLPDGSWVYAQSSMRLFLACAKALEIRFGPDREP